MTDKQNSDIVFNIFKELAEVYHQSLLIVTHDIDFAKKLSEPLQWKMEK